MTEDFGKATIPGRKEVYRLFLASGEPFVDIIYGADEPSPNVNELITCIHPQDEF